MRHLLTFFHDLLLSSMENSECIATKNKQIHPIGSFPHMLKLLIRLLQSTLLFEVESKVNPFEVDIFPRVPGSALPDCETLRPGPCTTQIHSNTRNLHRVTGVSSLCVILITNKPTATHFPSSQNKTYIRLTANNTSYIIAFATL